MLFSLGRWQIFIIIILVKRWQIFMAAVKDEEYNGEKTAGELLLGLSLLGIGTIVSWIPEA